MLVEKYIFDSMKPAVKLRLNVLISIIAVILIVYNVARAYTVSITHDEALTYQWYVSGSFSEILHNPQITANNHILNSLLAKLSINIFGDSLFALRLPNVLAYIAYLLFSFLLAKRFFQTSLFVLAAFLLLQLNPFLFDFWGLCRGYGIAIALMMGSLYYLFRFLEYERTTQLIVSVLFLSASVYAGFYMLNYAMGMVAVLGINILTKRKLGTIIKSVIAMLLGGGFIYWLVAQPITYLRESGELYYGGDSGFVKDTIGTLVQHNFHLTADSVAVLITSWVIAIAVLLAGTYWLLQLIINTKAAQQGLYLWLLLIVPALSTIVQVMLLDSKYLLDRTALFLYPLFMLSVLYTIQNITAGKTQTGKWVLLPLVLLFGTNFLAQANTSNTHIWYYDQHTHWLIERMQSHKKNEGKVKIYLEWMYTPSLRYYVFRNYKDKFGYIEDKNEAAYQKEDYDFYLIREWEVHKVPGIYELDTVFCNGEFYLYQRKQWDNNGTYEAHIP